MQFRTRLTPPPSSIFIDHLHPIVMFGSCFSTEIGGRLADRFFPVDINPFGTLYNPLSIARAINLILERRHFGPTDLVEHDGLYHSMLHHGDFSSPSVELTVNAINSRVDAAADALLTPGARLIVTFGSAIAFFLKSSGDVAGNCHRMPAGLFTQRELSISEILDVWRPLVSRLIDLNPSLRIIFTVSPIRHKAYGYTTDRLSKSRLLLAVDELVHDFPDISYYFPAFDIMMDDLRDYRFYAADMVHPSPVATDYIFLQFARTHYAPGEDAVSSDALCYSSLLNHRPRYNPEIHYARIRLARKRLIEKYPQLESLVPTLK